jgi:hypothetical protein
MSLHVGNGDKGRFVAEVTDAHEAIRQYVKQEAADEFVGHLGDSLFSISIFAISVTQGDFSVLDFNDAVIGQRE